MVKRCSICGSPAIDDLSRFCNTCGSQFPNLNGSDALSCLRCGTKNPDPLSRFCNKCGSPLQPPVVPKKEKVCPYCRVPVPDDSVFCVKCGSEIDSKRMMYSKKCPSCGGYVNEYRYYCNHCGAYLKGQQPVKVPIAGPAPGLLKTGTIRSHAGPGRIGKPPVRSRQGLRVPEGKEKNPPPYRIIGIGIIVLIIISFFILADIGTKIPVVLPSTEGLSFSDSGAGISNSAKSFSSSQLEIRINYIGAWTGSYTSGGSVTQVNGVGARSIVVKDPDPEISGTFTKAGQDTKPMTVQILKSGAIVTTESTSLPNGVVKVSYSEA